MKFPFISAELVCPDCGGREIYRARRKGLVDRLLSVLGMRPYWCWECAAKFHKPKNLGVKVEPAS